MSEPRPHVAFLGYVLPDHRFAALLESDRGMPVQTQRFGWAMVEALQSAQVTTIPISTDPAADFPHNSNVLFHRERFRERGASGLVIPFVNLTGVKHVSRFVSAGLALWTRHRRVALDAVVVHGVNSALLWSALLFGRVVSVPVVVVMTDPPSLRTAFDNAVTWRLKAIDRWVITSALRRTDGLVALAPRLATDFAPGVTALIMEGICMERPSDPPGTHSAPPAAGEEGAGPVVVYAGGIERAYGINDLVEAVGLSTGNWTLEVYGLGAEVPHVVAAAEADSRVRYRGMADQETLQDAYRRAALLVNPRRLDGQVPIYSFPSKLLEYLATGTPVMTTRLPTLPPDYEPVVVLAEQGADALARGIDGFLAKDSAVRGRLGAEGREFIVRTRGSHVQGARLRVFLEEVITARRRNGSNRSGTGLR